MAKAYHVEVLVRVFADTPREARIQAIAAMSEGIEVISVNEERQIFGGFNAKVLGEVKEEGAR